MLQQLAERELESPTPRLAGSYRRLIELSRQNDSIDTVLVAHLARELLSAVPGALGVEMSGEHLQYENVVDELAGLWPAGARDEEPPRQFFTELRRLFDAHDRASARARVGPRALVRQEDPAEGAFVPELSIDNWVDVSRRSSALAHQIAAVSHELPAPDEGRRLVEEVTAILHAIVAPFFSGIAELDRLIAVALPTQADANRAAALMVTAAQYAYFFEQIDERWLRALAGVGASHEAARHNRGRWGFPNTRLASGPIPWRGLQRLSTNW